MPLVYSHQTTFGSGEISPALWARTDLSSYLNALRLGRNICVMPHGGVRNRPGTKFVAAAGDSTHPVRLIPFNASATDTYVIELGHYYARFYTNSAPVNVVIADLPEWTSGISYNVGNYVKVGGDSKLDCGSGKMLYVHASYGFNTAITHIIINMASGDTLAVAAYTHSISIEFANSTASKNSASAIQTAIRALGTAYAAWTVAGNAAYVAAPPTANVVDDEPLTASNGTYYCLVANIAGVFLDDLASGYWVAQSAYQIATPWSSADIFNLKFAQSADVMFFAHPSYAPHTLTYYSASSWTVSEYEYIDGPFMLENTDLSNTLAPNAIVNGAPSSTAIASIVYGGSIAVNTSSAHGIITGETVTITGYTTGNALVDAQAGINFTAKVVSTTKIYLCLLGTTTIYTFAPYGGNPTTYSSPSGNVNGQTGVTLASSTGIFVAGHIGSFFQLISTINASTVTKSFTDYNQASSSVQCGHNWSIITSGSWKGILKIQASIDGGTTWTTIQILQSATSGDNFSTSGDSGFDQCLLRVYSNDTDTWTSGTAGVDLSVSSFDWKGIVLITHVSTSISASCTILPIGQANTGLANTTATWQWSEGSWSTLRGWPSAVSFFQDRLCWAGTPSEPQTIQLSKTGNYTDFGTSSPLQADDGFSVLLPSRTLNAIQNLIFMPQGLVALTTDSEWLVAPGPAGLSVSSVDVNLQGNRGSSSIIPSVVGLELLLMQRMGTICRNLIYQLAVNGYMGDNISIKSQHLFSGYTIVEMAYQQEPDSILWAVRSDGILLSCTYMRDQELNAWTWHDTAGTFESVCTVPNLTLGYNQPWFVVLRGSTRFIEYLAPRDMGTTPSAQYFVDCGKSYSGSATSFAFSHLPNTTTVSILADGNVIAQQQIASGTITLTTAATTTHIGLPFVSDIGTLKIESPSPYSSNPPGLAQGRRVAIPDVTLRFWNSRGGYYKALSQDLANPASTGTTGFDELIQRDASDPPTAAMPLRSRDYKVILSGGYDRGAWIMIRQVDPLPMCLLSLYPRLVISES